MNQINTSDIEIVRFAHSLDLDVFEVCRSNCQVPEYIILFQSAEDTRAFMQLWNNR